MIDDNIELIVNRLFFHLHMRETVVDMKGAARDQAGRGAPNRPDIAQHFIGCNQSHYFPISINLLVDQALNTCCASFVSSSFNCII